MQALKSPAGQGSMNTCSFCPVLCRCPCTEDAPGKAPKLYAKEDGTGGILPGGTERCMERDDEEKRYLVFVVAVADKDREATQIVPGNKITHSQLEEKNQLLRVSKSSLCQNEYREAKRAHHWGWKHPP